MPAIPSALVVIVGTQMLMILKRVRALYRAFRIRAGTVVYLEDGYTPGPG